MKRAISREIVYLRDDEVGFLNVDVDVFSKTPLDPLTAALGKPVLVNYVGREGRRYSAHFSLYDPSSADAAIRRLARLIMKLPTPARRLWDQASVCSTSAFRAAFVLTASRARSAAVLRWRLSASARP